MFPQGPKKIRNFGRFRGRFRGRRRRGEVYAIMQILSPTVIFLHLEAENQLGSSNTTS